MLTTALVAVLIVLALTNLGYMAQIGMIQFLLHRPGSMPSTTTVAFSGIFNRIFTVNFINANTALRLPSHHRKSKFKVRHPHYDAAKCFTF